MKLNIFGFVGIPETEQEKLLADENNQIFFKDSALKKYMPESVFGDIMAPENLDHHVYLYKYNLLKKLMSLFLLCTSATAIAAT